MKKILLSFDGTGNNAKAFAPDPITDRSFTNVLKLHLLAGGNINGKKINENDPDQICLYEEGIGGKTNNGVLANIRFSLGRLDLQLEPMRKKLEKVYERGDKLYMVGFSRGATSARKFATDLHKNGLKTKDGDHVDEPPIEFLGCFDTVSMQVFEKVFTVDALRFVFDQMPRSAALGEDGKIAPNVKKAVHLIALDETRRFYPVTHMDSVDNRVHECFFPGEHCDVGGSYYTKGIPDGACKYMQEWLESLDGDNAIRFMKPEEIKPESLVIDGSPDIKIDASDLTIVPDPTDKIHLREIHLNSDDFREVVAVSNDKVVPNATVNVHVSTLQHMEAMGGTYRINESLKDANIAIVGTLGEKMEEETRRFKQLINKQ